MDPKVISQHVHNQFQIDERFVFGAEESHIRVTQILSDHTQRFPIAIIINESLKTKGEDLRDRHNHRHSHVV